MDDSLPARALQNGMIALLIGAATIVAARPAYADNPLGLYIGGGVGQSHVRNDFSALSNVHGFVENHTGWKALIGARPLSLLGVELEYADFGHPGESSVGPIPPGLIYNLDVSQKATSVFGLLYLPLPLPVVDIYGKAGVSRLQTDVNASWRCVAPVTCPANPVYSQDSTDSRLAYGAGVQAKFLGLGLRAEYERIGAPAGSPDLYSLIAIWTF
jgi:opacity protein-like surface antigen